MTVIGLSSFCVCQMITGDVFCIVERDTVYVEVIPLQYVDASYHLLG